MSTANSENVLETDMSGTVNKSDSDSRGTESPAKSDRSAKKNMQIGSPSRVLLGGKSSPTKLPLSCYSPTRNSTSETLQFINT